MQVDIYLIISVIALIIALLDLVFRAWPKFVRYREEKENERRKAKQELEEKIRRCESLKRGICNHIRLYVKKYKFNMVGEISGGWGLAPTTKLQEMMKIFYEKNEECVTWLKASKRILKLVLWEVMEWQLSKSKDSYLQDLFEKVLIDQIIKEVRVSMPWLQTERPDLIEVIEGKIDPSDDFNEFLKRLNEYSNNELALKTLREKRRELMVFAEKFRSTIDAEQHRLEIDGSIKEETVYGFEDFFS